MGVIKTALLVIAALIGAQLLGGVLGATALMAARGVVVGTPLGPGSPVAPVAWTVIALVGLYGAREVVA